MEWQEVGITVEIQKAMKYVWCVFQTDNDPTQLVSVHSSQKAAEKMMDAIYRLIEKHDEVLDAVRTEHEANSPEYYSACNEVHRKFYPGGHKIMNFSFTASYFVERVRVTSVK